MTSGRTVNRCDASAVVARRQSVLSIFALKHMKGETNISSISYQTNREIRDKEVRVVTESGEQLGVMPIRAAMDLAANRDLDLVKVQPNANPPVCKLMDYGKFKFEQSKKEKEIKKNQHVTETKEIRLSPGIGAHDYDTKLKNGRSFLEEGDRLKVNVRFRGREMAHTDIGRELLKKFAEACADVASVTSESKLDGRNMTMVLTPRAQSSKQEGTKNAQSKNTQRSKEAVPAD